MPELTAIHLALLVAAIVIGAIIGWALRGKRSRQEKRAINVGWQEQIDAQRREHDRLTEQNKGLMEQIAQYQASNKDAKNRARELSEAVQEAFARRDELQREIKDIRGNLEVAVDERDQLQSNIAAQRGNQEWVEAKQAQIRKLKSELDNWKNRLPPLIEKFRQKNEEAEKLEAELSVARGRITELENDRFHEQTQIEPVSDPESLTDGRDASNDTLENSNIVVQIESLAQAESAPVLAAVTDPLPDLRDELQQIKGIGPAIEKTLNEMGIVSFQQIAEMSEYDIDRVANRLKGFHSRIYREDWIGQARDLRDQKASG